MSTSRSLLTWKTAFFAWALFYSLYAQADVKTAYRHYKEGSHAQALQLALPDARKGHPRASELVGYLYMKGEGAPQNHKLAYEYLHKAAKAGLTSAQANLGVLLINGWGTEKNLTLAFHFFELAAQKGDAFSQAQAARMLVIGQGTEKNIDKAVDYLKSSAQAKNSEAEVLLALLIQRGATLEEQPLQAYYLLQSAAEKGNAQAHYLLGRLHIDKQNELAEVNVDKAIAHLKKAAAGGVADASLFLSQIYSGYYGTPKNPLLAIHWMQHFQNAHLSNTQKVQRDWVGAVDEGDFKDWRLLQERLKTKSASGHAPSTHNLSLLYFNGSAQTKPNLEQAIALMSQSVQAGQVESMLMLAKWQLAGVEGTNSDSFEALRLLETAAQSGNTEALFELGKFHYDFLGNPAKGLDYVQQAANQRHAAAKFFLMLVNSE